MIKPNDWKTEAMPNETESFYSGRVLMSQEYEKLQEGMKPKSMDDKWFVYFHEENIYFHQVTS